MSFRTETYKDSAGEHRWRLLGNNGRIIGASSEGFASKRNATQNMNLVLYGMEYPDDWERLEPPAALREPEGLLAGDQLLPREVAALNYSVNFRDVDRLVDMTATVYAESAGYTEAVGGPNGNGTYDYGLYQLNSAHRGSMSDGEFRALAFNPERAAAFARKLYVNAGYSLRPWYGYTNGSYKRHLPKSVVGVANMIAERRQLQPVPLARYA